MGRGKNPEQPSLFGDDPLPDGARTPGERSPKSKRNACPPEAATIDADLAACAAKIPQTIRLGTSSWSFPGWRGLVWGRETTESALARDGLRAYAVHPLFRTVGLDKTFYRPAPREEFARLRAQVPADFRFLVKAHEAITNRVQDARRMPAPRAWLDCGYAIEQVIDPATAGLQECAGPILFQFPPMEIRAVAAAEGFIRELGRFVAALPLGPLYTLEVRDRILMRPSWAAMLRDTGATHCYNAHPSQPSVDEQSRIVDPANQRSIVARWMLHSTMSYGDAVGRYEPFDKIVDPDPQQRDQFAQLCNLAAQADKHAFVIINNKAEGSAPRSVELLARAIVATRSRAMPPQ